MLLINILDAVISFNAVITGKSTQLHVSPGRKSKQSGSLLTAVVQKVMGYIHISFGLVLFQNFVFQKKRKDVLCSSWLNFQLEWRIWRKCSIRITNPQLPSCLLPRWHPNPISSCNLEVASSICLKISRCHIGLLYVSFKSIGI